MTASGAADQAGSHDGPSPVNYTQHFGHEGRARQLASLRVLLSAFTGVPGIIGLHGGLPPADAFPFTEMSFTLRDGTKLEIKEPEQVWQRTFIVSWTSKLLPWPNFIAITQPFLLNQAN